MNATAIAVGGINAFQIDYGNSTVTGGPTQINFHFTFRNTPLVICSIVGNISGNVYTAATYSTTQTGFYCTGTYYAGSGSVGGFYGTVNWIAIG